MREAKLYSLVPIGKGNWDLSDFFDMVVDQAFDEKKTPKVSDIVEGLDYYVRSCRNRKYNKLSYWERLDVARIATHMQADVKILRAIFEEG